MTENTTGATEEKSNDQLEKAKQDTLLHLLGMVKTFADTDMAITKDLELFLRALADYAKKNPEAIFSGGSDADIGTLITVLKKAGSGSGGCGKSDIIGNDIVGGAPDLGDILNRILEFIATEKKFVIAILLLIFCPLKACDCLCSYINSSNKS